MVQTNLEKRVFSPRLAAIAALALAPAVLEAQGPQKRIEPYNKAPQTQVEASCAVPAQTAAQSRQGNIVIVYNHDGKADTLAHDPNHGIARVPNFHPEKGESVAFYVTNGGRLIPGWGANVTKNDTKLVDGVLDKKDGFTSAQLKQGVVAHAHVAGTNTCSTDYAGVSLGQQAAAKTTPAAPKHTTKATPPASKKDTAATPAPSETYILHIDVKKDTANAGQQNSISAVTNLPSDSAFVRYDGIRARMNAADANNEIFNRQFITGEKTDTACVTAYRKDKELTVCAPVTVPKLVVVPDMMAAYMHLGLIGGFQKETIKQQADGTQPSYIPLTSASATHKIVGATFSGATPISENQGWFKGGLTMAKYFGSQDHDSVFVKDASTRPPVMGTVPVKDADVTGFDIDAEGQVVYKHLFAEAGLGHALSDRPTSESRIATTQLRGSLGGVWKVNNKSDIYLVVGATAEHNSGEASPTSYGPIAGILRPGHLLGKRWDVSVLPHYMMNEGITGVRVDFDAELANRVTAYVRAAAMKESRQQDIFAYNVMAGMNVGFGGHKEASSPKKH